MRRKRCNVRGDPQDTAKYIAERISDATGVLCFDEYKNMFPNCIVECFGSQDDLGAQAREVFDRLRAFDDTSVTQIWAQCPSDEGLGLAVANRIKKAAGFSVIEI
ncbi:MAG: Sua5 family C-terminal domain-containing protein [Butyricicoccus sp.]